MKRIAIYLILLFCPLFIFSEADRNLAELYTDEAFYYYERENYSLADKYMEKAMEFSQDEPESWYLSGLLREEQGDRIKAIELYGKSIDRTEVFTDFFYDLYFRYLNLLNVTAHHEEVIDFFEKNKEIFESDLEIILKVSDSAFRYGLVEYSRDLALNVYRRNPFSLRSLLYLMRVDDKENYSEKIRLALYNLEIEQFDEVIFQKLLLDSDEPERSNLLSLYEDIFGETEFLLLQKDMSNDELNRSRNLMIRSYGSEELGNGVYFGDYNFDGISDEIVSAIGDDLTYLRDKNQDNVTDLSINFTNGIPQNIFLNHKGVGYEFAYSSYPYLKSVGFYQNKNRREYKVYPGTAFTPLNDLDSFDWKYDENRSFLTEDFSLNESQLMEMSYLLHEYNPDSEEVFREYSLINGEIRGIRERNGISEDFNYFLDIIAWIPEAGHLDLNSDGLIDIYEYYEDGKIQGIAIDWNNNGKPEYIEDWSVLNIKTWDFNEDSHINAEYIHKSSNNNVYYSTPYEKEDTLKSQLYSWDFSYENFWFNNN